MTFYMYCAIVWCVREADVGEIGADNIKFTQCFVPRHWLRFKILNPVSVPTEAVPHLLAAVSDAHEK